MYAPWNMLCSCLDRLKCLRHRCLVLWSAVDQKSNAMFAHCRKPYETISREWPSPCFSLGYSRPSVYFCNLLAPDGPLPQSPRGRCKIFTDVCVWPPGGFFGATGEVIGPTTIRFSRRDGEVVLRGQLQASTRELRHRRARWRRPYRRRQWQR